MHLKKALISSMLLLVYTFSFAHELIPHCHHTFGNVGKSHVHVMKHEHHGEDDHSHISHNGHHDEGLIDLLVCVLIETEHPGSEGDQLFFLPKTENNKLNDRLKVQFASILTILFDFYEDNSEVTPQPDVNDFYSSPFLAHTPHRGPPSISC